MHILFISQFFEPEPAFKGLQFAQALVDRGHSVEVLTGFPNYPGGVVFPGYRVSALQRETMNGIAVHRVYLYASHDKSAVRRSANYLSFALSATIGALAAVRRPDVAYVYHPPATAALPAIALRRVRGVPFVIDVQDLWPDTITATGMLRNRHALRALGGLAALTYSEAARVVVQSEGFYRALADRGVPASKLAVIHNWSDEASFLRVAPQVRAGGPTLEVLFAGTMGIAQALDSVLDAAEIAREELPQVRFTFVGGGTDRERLERDAAMRNLANVRFLARRDPRDMAPLYETADILLVHLKDDPLFRITIPSKTQAYLAAGRPILAAVEGDAAAMIERSGAGLHCRPGDARQLVDALRRFAAMPPDARIAMGAAGRRYYLSELSLAAGTSRFESVFAAAARTPIVR